MSHTDGRETARRVQELRTFAQGTRVVPILLQEDPDPDGMGSALAIRTLLHRTADESPVVSLGEVTRSENQRLAELIGLRVTRVSESELHGFQRVIAVDTQPKPVQSETRYAVIDHHPVRSGYSADFVDIRPEMGAAATMLTQYLRVADEGSITPRLATALIYGIRPDTEVLRRGTTAADVEAYAFLQDRADHPLLRKIGRPAFSGTAVRALGGALAGLGVRGELAVAYAGALDTAGGHVLPNLADFCLSVQGVSWSAAAGLVDGELVMNLRRVGGSPGAGDLAKALAQEEGLGGGHASMARVVLRKLEGLPLSDQAGDADSVAWLAEQIQESILSARSGPVRSDEASD